MNSVISTDPLLAPHLRADPRLSPFHQDMPGSRKRKASEEPDHDRMSTSPVNSPSTAARSLPRTKRTRTHFSGGRPLPLPRLLQTLSLDEMRSLLQAVCDENPGIKQEVVRRAPRPSIQSVLNVLTTYERDFQQAFPYGTSPTSDYTFNRVQLRLADLLDALREYTPYYLPPQETASNLSLSYLDAATNIVHHIPDWDDVQHRRHKTDAYEEIVQAWLLVLKEAQKTSAVFRLQAGGWETKLAEHNRSSGGRFASVIQEFNKAIGFGETAGTMDDRASIRQQLMSGTYGQQLGVGPGQW